MMIDDAIMMYTGIPTETLYENVRPSEAASGSVGRHLAASLFRTEEHAGMKAFRRNRRDPFFFVECGLENRADSCYLRHESA